MRMGHSVSWCFDSSLAPILDDDKPVLISFPRLKKGDSMLFCANLLSALGLLLNLAAAGLLQYYQPKITGATTTADLQMLKELDPMLSTLIDYRFAILTLGFGAQFTGAGLRFFV